MNRSGHCRQQPYGILPYSATLPPRPTDSRSCRQQQQAAAARNSSGSRQWQQQRQQQRQWQQQQAVAAGSGSGSKQRQQAAASGKRQAASGKRQAASGKRQAASGKRQRQQVAAAGRLVRLKKPKLLELTSTGGVRGFNTLHGSQMGPLAQRPNQLL